MRRVRSSIQPGRLDVPWPTVSTGRKRNGRFPPYQSPARTSRCRSGHACPVPADRFSGPGRNHRTSKSRRRGFRTRLHNRLLSLFIWTAECDRTESDSRIPTSAPKLVIAALIHASHSLHRGARIFIVWPPTANENPTVKTKSKVAIARCVYSPLASTTSVGEKTTTWPRMFQAMRSVTLRQSPGQRVNVNRQLSGTWEKRKRRVCGMSLLLWCTALLASTLSWSERRISGHGCRRNWPF